MKRVVMMVALPLMFDAAVGCALVLDAHPKLLPLPVEQKLAATVFFYWDDANISPHARQVLAGLAHAQPGHAPARILADSAADSLQGASYAALLTRRRLDSIVAELVRDGVPVNRIAANPATSDVIVNAPLRLAGN